MIYTYRCLECNTVFEITQSIKDKPLKKHSDILKGKYVKYISPKAKMIITECKGKIVRVVTGGCGFVLKGEGWTRKRSRAMKKIDNALGNAGVIEDHSKGWSHRDD